MRIQNMEIKQEKNRIGEIYKTTVKILSGKYEGTSIYSTAKTFEDRMADLQKQFDKLEVPVKLISGAE